MLVKRHISGSRHIAQTRNLSQICPKHPVPFAFEREVLARRAGPGIQAPDGQRLPRGGQAEAGLVRALSVARRARGAQEDRAGLDRARRPATGYFTKRTAEAWLGDVLDQARRGTLPGAIRTGATFADAAAEYLRYIEVDRGRKATTV